MEVVSSSQANRLHHCIGPVLGPFMLREDAVHAVLYSASVSKHQGGLPQE